jgi:hypothetical protein
MTKRVLVVDDDALLGLDIAQQLTCSASRPLDSARPRRSVKPARSRRAPVGFGA